MFHVLSIAVLAGMLWTRNSRLMEDVREIKADVKDTAASSQKNSETLVALSLRVEEIAGAKQDHETRIRVLEALVRPERRSV